MLLPLLFAIDARAEIMMGESLDWAAVDADVVARARVERLGATDIALTDVVALRGSLPTTELAASLCAPLDVEPGEDVIVFLRAEADGWVPRCATDRAQTWLFSLDEPRRAYTIDGRALTTGAEVLSHALAAGLRPVSAPPIPAATAEQRFQLQHGPIRVEVDGPGAGQDLYAGSTVYLAIPTYTDLLDDILAASRSDRPDVRESAAQQLANYAVPEAEQRLRELLADDYEAEWRDGSGTVVQRTWPVREAAWASLVAHGADLSGLQEPR
jgi:hypothetical protein